MDRILATDKYFCRLIDLIPPKIYFESNDEIKEVLELEKRVKFADEDLSIQAKHKKAKFDFELTANKTVTEIATEFADMSEKKLKDKKKKKRMGQPTELEAKISSLKKKLKERIQEMRSKRGGTRHKHEKLVQRGSKKDRKMKNRNQPGAKQRGFVKNKIKNGEAGDDEESKKKKENTNTPKIYNHEGKLVFSKFDLIKPVKFDQEDSKPKKSLKRKLQEVKKEEAKIAKLEQTNPEVAEKVKNKKLWKAALEKSEGIKVKNNPKLLEKTIKRKEKMKKKNAEKWKERKEMVNKKIEKRQEKRQRNINKKKERNNKNKLDKLKKKGRGIPMKKK